MPTKQSGKPVPGKKGKKSAKRWIKVTKAGKVTVKKGTPKGYYKLTYTVRAKATSAYQASNAKKVTLYGEPVSLTPTEYDILNILIHSPGKVFSSKELYQQIRNEDPFGAEASIPVHIRHLREKIEPDPTNPRLLKVVWGKGYKLEP